MTRKLTMDDIQDLRAYERDRIETRSRIMAMKKPRRLSVGPLVTMVFENRDTMWYQIQEMARVERLLRDEQIEEELRTYNPLIPDPGELSATLFVELTTDAQMHEWLPKLVGIERAVRLHIGEGGGRATVAFGADAQHDQQLTREAVTAAVHYVKACLTWDQVAAFRRGPVTLAVDHPAYDYSVVLSPDTIATLALDLEPD